MNNGKTIHLERGTGLYDGQGNVCTRFHPRFDSIAHELKFSTGYNPVPERRGQSGGASQNGSRESWSSNRDRMKAMWDARDLCTHEWVGGIIGRIVMYVAGTITSKSETGDPQLNQAYDDYFHGWCGDIPNPDDNTTRCDITGRHRFAKLVQMAFAGFLVDGDAGFVEVDPAQSPAGEFCLQSIQADRIGSPNEATTEESYIGGIGINRDFGRVEFYRIFERTRTNQYVNAQEVPPQAFIHVFDPEWPDEYRGRTKMLRMLNDCRDIKEWVEAEKIAGKTQSQWAALIGTKDPFSQTGPGAYTGTTANGTPTQDAQWGKILKMAEGENFSMLSPSARPSGAFMMFVQTLIRRMALSLGVSYGFMWDLASLGGVSARIELQGDLRKIQYWQNNILIGKILNRVRNKVIAQAIAQQQLPPCQAWNKCGWSFGPHITTDAGYEMRNDLDALGAGISAVSDITAKYGKSPAEVFSSNATTANEAINVGTNASLPVEVFARGLYSDITAQRAAYLQSQQPPLPPASPVSIGVLGDKGIKPLIDIMEKVGSGMIDRESAINAIIEIYSQPDNPLSRQDAEKLIPEEPSEEDLNRDAGLSPEGEHAPVVSGPKASSSKPKPGGARK